MSSVMATFPEWSDDDSGSLDDFLSQPWPDETRTGVRTNSDGWPEFQSSNKWRQFSSQDGSKIVRISAAVPSVEEDDGRDDYHTKRSDWNDVRDDFDDDESVLTLTSMASATVELARHTTPTKSHSPQRLFRQKIPMLLCKSERIKQSSPGDKRVHFEDDGGSNEENIPLDPIVEIGVDNLTETFKMERPTVVKPTIIRKPPRFQQGRRSTFQPVVLRKNMVQKQIAERPVPESKPSIQAYSGQCSPSNWIHNANLFEDKTLPSNTLDFFCRDSALAGSGVPAVKEVSYSEEDTATCSSRSTGSGVSSLASGAVDEKLAHLFSFSSISEATSTRDLPAPRISARDPPAKRVQQDYRYSYSIQYDDEVDNHPTPTIHTPKPSKRYYEEPSIDTTSPHNHSHHGALFHHQPPSGTKVADRQKWLNSAFKRDAPSLDGRPGTVPVSRLNGTIEKFGGRATRVNAVKQKKEEFERKMAEKNRRKPTTKTKWEGRPGSYKKKVVLSTHEYY